ncbi:efflux RND transporter periplasmic adaptor subunit [Vibrio sp. JC009]|uniref:efflux RND transporter periplasmic adaptor subunit n=1 Tax=Vibrio sp. JC009 TaxID=2912314 RepID=UPI0023AEEF9A|nr:efflux RND transporter periplasmic adaptor subunit [Vibrio sp. JC009]WED24342.1 efflux RND transporter periplasmic adaptor subunit [Vibrio sp. JC009]
MHNKALVTILKLAFVSSVALFVNGCGQANSEPQKEVIKPVKLYQVPGFAADSNDAFLAEVDAGERSQLSFQVPGVVENLAVKEGQKVEKGQLLAVLDPKDYQLAVDAAQAQFDLAETRFLRDKKLFDKRLISADSFDQTETSYKAAIANLEEAKTDFSYTEIQAPFDGVVSLSFVKAHQYVAAKQPILNIINNEELDINISVPVPYIDQVGVAKFQAGQFIVVFDVFPGVIIPAQFKEMSTQANDTNSYNATVSILKPDDLTILTGMTGQVFVAGNQQKSAVTLPESAWVSKTADSGKVWRMNQKNNSVELIELKLDGSGAVTDGLNAGDLVVIAGTKDLTEGQVVKAWEREGGI